ncbi:MAG: hypothetical protein ACJ8FC_12725 [Sphingomicrobium sp.]
MSAAELASFCETVTEVLGDDLSRRGYHRTAYKVEQDHAECDYTANHGRLRFYFSPRDGEVGCLVEAAGRWQPILSHLDFGRDMSDEELAEATDAGDESIEASLRFYQTFFDRLA